MTSDVPTVFPGLERAACPELEACAHLIAGWVADRDVAQYVNERVLPAAGMTPRQLAETDPSRLLMLLSGAHLR